MAEKKNWDVTGMGLHMQGCLRDISLPAHISDERMQG